MNSNDREKGLKAFGNDLLKINGLQMFPPFGLNLHSYLFVRHPHQQLITLKLAAGTGLYLQQRAEEESGFAAIPGMHQFTTVTSLPLLLPPPRFSILKHFLIKVILLEEAQRRILDNQKRKQCKLYAKP